MRLLLQLKGSGVKIKKTFEHQYKENKFDRARFC